jgi:hypothetical protein
MVVCYVAMEWCFREWLDDYFKVMKMSTNMWIYWDDAVMGSCGDEDWDNPKGRNGYNAQATGDCTNVYQKGRPGRLLGKERDK